ncbi:MAG TPA: hypothetical protein VFZ61_12255, partial [Polyangiales bacterium]
MQTPRARETPTKALHFRQLLMPEGWASEVRLELEDGVFVHIERGVPPLPDDERLALGVPGLSNLHSHGFQRALSGLSEARGAEPDSFW